MLLTVSHEYRQHAVCGDSRLCGVQKVQSKRAVIFSLKFVRKLLVALRFATEHQFTRELLYSNGHSSTKLFIQR